MGPRTLVVVVVARCCNYNKIVLSRSLLYFCLSHTHFTIYNHSLISLYKYVYVCAFEFVYMCNICSLSLFIYIFISISLYICVCVCMKTMRWSEIEKENRNIHLVMLLTSVVNNTLRRMLQQFTEISRFNIALQLNNYLVC